MAGIGFVIAVAVVAGVAVALQGQLMGIMDRAAGTTASVFITYGVGGLLAALLYAVKRGPAVGLRQIPWYAWSAGVFGLIIVAGIGYAAPRIGLARTLIVTVAAQLIAAVLIDHFGWFGGPQRAIDAARAAGLLVTVAGVWLVVRT